MHLPAAVGAGVLLSLTMACVGPRPNVPVQSALYRDVERHIKVAAAAGWRIDTYEIEELIPFALTSVCRVPKHDRIATADWVAAEIERNGGPVEEAYERREKDLDEVKDLLRLTRIHMLLTAASARADRECPFWIEPDPDFKGRQILDDSWVLTFGGGGKGIAFFQDGQADVSAGGAGRIIVGRAFGTSAMLSLGIEIGALAEFPRDDENGDRGALVLGLEAVVPIVFRYRLINSYFEFEAGPLAQGREDRDELVYGGHIGASIGGQATRRLFVLPGGAFTISVERTLRRGDISPTTQLKAGFRAAIDLPF